MSIGAGRATGNTLNASELLRNKGIRYEAWAKWGKTASILPKTGKKQFEPNNSWLQNKQIEKGLQDRKDLLEIERVERSSQLAIAEWLPHQKKARVTKKSGQEWVNFGLEVNSQLYLIPEEALLLLELNSLELTWNGVALSIQQAYSMLIDSDQSGCTMEEYRVYSQLARQGYRLQRFYYEREPSRYERSMRLDQPSLKRKKFIVDPENGLRRGENPIEIDLSSEEIWKDKLRNERVISDSTELSKIDEPTESSKNVVERDVQSLMETIIQSIESDQNIEKPGDSKNQSIETCKTNAKDNDEHENSMEISLDDKTFSTDNKENCEECEKTIGQGNETVTRPEGIMDGKTENGIKVLEKNFNQAPNDSKISKKLLSELYDNGVENLPGPSNVESTRACNKNERRSKIEIISEETVLENIRIISNVPNPFDKSEKKIQKWPGTRIQRNVKLLPKRDDKVPHPATALELQKISVINIDGDCDGDADNNAKMKNTDSCARKRSDNSAGEETFQKKRSKLEVIELSDDEIEEIPQRMSRMEMLNLFPDIAHRNVITEKISRRYLPHNVRPQKNTYQYMKWKLVKTQDGRTPNAHRQTENIEGVSQNGHRNVNENENMSGHNVNVHQKQIQSIYNILFPNMFANRVLGNMVRQGQLSNGNAFLNSNTSQIPNLNRFPFNQSHQNFGQSTYVRQSLIQNRVAMGYFNRPSPWNHREQLSIQVNNYTNIAITQNVMRPAQFGMQNQFRHSSWQGANFFPRQNLNNQWSRPFYGQTPTCNFYRNPAISNVRKNLSNGRNIHCVDESQEVDEYRPSFKKVQNASSWAETKEKWLEEKTITIDDEDPNNVGGGDAADESEVQVVDRPIKPLVGPRNSGTLAEIYRSLQIIKPAPERNVRQLRGRTVDYKISYNLYPSTPHFKKANPGTPMYRLVVFKGEDSAFIQPAELNRLQREAKDAPVMLCCVSNTSITFAQLGIVTIPNF